MKIQGKCEGPKWLREDSNAKAGKMGQITWEEHDMVGRVDRNGEAFNLVQKVFG